MVPITPITHHNLDKTSLLFTQKTRSAFFSSKLDMITEEKTRTLSFLQGDIMTNLTSPGLLPRMSGTTRVAPRYLATTTASAI